ncbi:MAG: DUF4339 domain-containing protein [Labilithrix sp.]
MESYREPGKRKKVPRKLRSWFVQNADGSEKGPFEYDSLVSSGKADRIKPSTLVRAEDEKEWQPLSELLAKEEKRAAKKAAELGLSSGSSSSSGDAPEELGNFGAGLCAGLFGGFIGFGLVMVLARGTETKRGARWGLVAQLGVGFVLRLMLAGASSSRY